MELEADKNYKEMVHLVHGMLKRQLQQAHHDIQTLQDLKLKALQHPVDFIREIATKPLSTKIPALQSVPLIPQRPRNGHHEGEPGIDDGVDVIDLEVDVDDKTETKKSSGGWVAEDWTASTSTVASWKTFESPVERLKRQARTVPNYHGSTKPRFGSASAPVTPQHSDDYGTPSESSNNGEGVWRSPSVGTNLQRKLTDLGISLEDNGLVRSLSAPSSPPSPSPNRWLAYNGNRSSRRDKDTSYYPTNTHSRRSATNPTVSKDTVSAPDSQNEKRGPGRPPGSKNRFPYHRSKGALSKEIQRRKMRKIEAIDRRREKVVSRGSSTVTHYGFKCDSCGMEPILGVRWKCTDCPQTEDTDLCENCIKIGFRNAVHKLNHRFEKVEKSEQFRSEGTYSMIGGEFSYLDPSYNWK